MDPFEENSPRENEFPQLSWKHYDIEQRFGFHGGRYTSVNMLFTGLLALMFSVAFFAILEFIPRNHIIQMFTDRGIVPYPIVLLGFWTFFILVVKQWKIYFQSQPLEFPIPSDDSAFVLTPSTADEVNEQIRKNADNPKDFLLYRRIVLALSNLKYLRRVSDVDDFIRSQADQDAEAMETSYTIINGFLWAIPILGFIGTVLGLSQAIGKFSDVLKPNGDFSQLIAPLQDVLANLSTAFETTLIALVIALFLQLYSFAVRKREEEFLDDCAEFCTIKIVARLRMDFNDNEEEH